MDSDFEYIKEVVCSWNDGRKEQLVVGQSYKVIAENELTYKIRIGKENIICIKSRFKE